MGKQLLVAGGCGFLGSHLVDRLLERADVARLLVVDNLWTGRRENLQHVADSRLEIEVSDVETFHAEASFDEIYHFASPATPAQYMKEPVRVIRANVQGALNLMTLLSPGGRLCFASSSEVYGEPLVNPQPESFRGSVDCTGPRASYDESKRCTEALLLEAQRVHGLDVRVARLFNVYGPRTQADDGRAVSNFIGQALAGEKLTIYGDGLQTRCWGYVDDMMEALSRFFWLDPITHVGPLNIGNDREIPVVEIARHVAKLVPGARIKFLPAPPQDPASRRPDLELAAKVLPGWRPHTPYEIGVERTLAWFRMQLSSGCPTPERSTTAGVQA